MSHVVSEIVMLAMLICYDTIFTHCFIYPFCRYFPFMNTMHKIIAIRNGDSICNIIIPYNHIPLIASWIGRHHRRYQSVWSRGFYSASPRLLTWSYGRFLYYDDDMLVPMMISLSQTMKTTTATNKTVVTKKKYTSNRVTHCREVERGFQIDG